MALRFVSGLLTLSEKLRSQDSLRFLSRVALFSFRLRRIGDSVNVIQTIINIGTHGSWIEILSADGILVSKKVLEEDNGI